MAETTREDQKGTYWLKKDVEADISKYLDTDELFMREDLTGVYKGSEFAVKLWIKDRYLAIMTAGILEELEDAFSQVVEYFPVVRYRLEDRFVTVWNKHDPEGQIEILEEEGVRGLVRLIQ